MKINKKIPLICPMKFALNNCKDYSCSQENCAWWRQYINGEGECAIHSLPGLFDSLQDIAKETDISESLTRKNPLKEVKTAKVITRTRSKP